MAKEADEERTGVQRVWTPTTLALLCLLPCIPEVCCKSVLVSGSLRSNVSGSSLGGLSRLYGGRQERNRTESDALVPQAKNPDALSIVQNDLMLVTVMAESSPAEKDHVTFWVDRTMAAMTVTVKNRGPQNCLLVSQFGDRPPPSLFSRRTTVWRLDTPRVGRWRVEQEGEGGYEVRVEGSSSENIEVTLYDVNMHTGLAVFVLSSPTAGHQIRTIIDVIGTDVIKNLYNMSLVTSEGVELASNWLRAAGGPRDPQYSSTFTWPTQAVYIRVYGEEEKGTVFERQTPFIITPILIDLQLQGGATSDVVGPEGSLTVRYRLLNHGPSDTFQLTAHSDTDVLGAVVSPATIHLGQQGSVLGSVSVTVPPYSSSTSGLLTVKVWSVANPEMMQTASLFLTFPYTVPDLDPPSCQTVTLTGKCTPWDVTSPTCHLRHWRVQVSVEDDVSGLKNVTFSDVTKRDLVQVPSYEEGLSGHPLVVGFRASCCRAQILLDIADVAGNERQCQYFQAEIPPPLHTPTPTPWHQGGTWSTTAAESPRPGGQQVTSDASQGHQGSGDHDLDLTTGRSVSPGRSEVTVTSNVTSSPQQLNETLVGSDGVTHSRGGKRGQGDHSTLTTASIILGSIGGSAGLCIALICLLLFCRHRRQLQHRRRHSCNSNHSSCSDHDGDGDCHHGSYNHHHPYRRGHEGENGHNRHFHGNSNENSPCSNRSSHSYHYQGSSNSSSSSSRNSNHRYHGDNSRNGHRHHNDDSSTRHHSDNSRNSHRHHGVDNNHHHHSNNSNGDNPHHSHNIRTDQRRNDADHNQPQVWNHDGRHHHHPHHGNAGSRSGASQYHHSNGADARVREHREGQRRAMPDVLPETESVTEFSTAL